MNIIASDLHTRFGTKTTRKRSCRAKIIVLHMMTNDFEKSYVSLHDYANIIFMNNRGTTLKIQHELVVEEA